MSDDEADPELLELLRQRLGISSGPQDGIPRDTGVLKNAEFIYGNSIDVHVDMYGTKSAALQIYKAMRERGYSTETWSTHELHPKASEGFSEVDIVNFVFTMDLLNFSFWSELPSEERFQVEYRGQRWTGYNSLVACLRRALDEGIPFTTPRFWTDSNCTEQTFSHVFRSATAEPIPLLQQRIAILSEASNVLRESFAGDEDEDEIGDETHQGKDDSIDTPAVTDIIAAAPVDQVSDLHDTGHQSATPMSLLSAASGDLAVPATPSQNAEALTLDDLLDIGTDSRQPGDLISPPATTTGVRTELGPTVPEDASTVADNGIHTGPDPEFMPGSLRLRIDLRPDYAVTRLIQQADQSAGKLVNLLAKHFGSFDDVSRFDGRKVRLFKRAQIFVADLWAAFNGTGYGRFDDIDHLTMFADYRVPQSLHSLGVISYSPPLDYHIRNLRSIAAGHPWEVQLRGCSIWAVELIRREILREHPEATSINAVLIDFLLYDLAKEREAQGQHAIPHHRTRSIWY